MPRLFFINRSSRKIITVAWRPSANFGGVYDSGDRTFRLGRGETAPGLSVGRNCQMFRMVWVGGGHYVTSRLFTPSDLCIINNSGQ